MTCDREYEEVMQFKDKGGIHAVLTAYAEELYKTLNSSPGAFMKIAGDYQELRVLVDDFERKLALYPKEVEAYREFLACVAKHLKR